jgi:hypothetical protein
MFALGATNHLAHFVKHHKAGTGSALINSGNVAHGNRWFLCGV